MSSLVGEAKGELGEALERAADDPAVRAVVLTGWGRAFGAGQDLREHAAGLASGLGLNGTVREHYNPIVLAITTMPKPVVAAVNGVAAGAGASLAFACDLTIASEKASFMMAFPKIGLAPHSGPPWTLHRRAGPPRPAAPLLLAGPGSAARGPITAARRPSVPRED